MTTFVITMATLYVIDAGLRLLLISCAPRPSHALTFAIDVGIAAWAIVLLTA